MEHKNFDKFFKIWSEKTITLVYQGLFCEQCEKVTNEIKKGKIVVTAGWHESFIAHHSMFGYLSKRKELRKMLDAMAFNNLRPDLTFFIDIPVKEVCKRMCIRGNNFFDQQGAEYYAAIDQYYRKICKEERWVAIDGMSTVKKINTIILNKVLIAIQPK